MPDSELWLRVVDEGALFVTADKGFGDVRAYPPGSHAGIVVLRPERESVSAYAELARTLVAAHSIAGLAGCLVVVSPRGIRLRRSTTR